MGSPPRPDTTATVAFLRERVTVRPRVALILGSGLSGLADTLEESVRIPFEEVPGFSPTAVAGHRGALVAGHMEGVPCIGLQGRYHVYEGYDHAAVTRPLRAVAGLGARILVVTNAAGGLNPTHRTGDLMIIADHIDLMGRYRAPGRWQVSDAYDPELRELALRCAVAERVGVVEGVYCAGTGPSYETPAEVRMLRRLGADAVGMSTVPEVLVARDLGLRVLGISLVSNPAAGLTREPLAHEDVVAAGEAAVGRFARLVRAVARELGGREEGGLPGSG